MATNTLKMVLEAAIVRSDQQIPAGEPDNVQVGPYSQLPLTYPRAHIWWIKQQDLSTIKFMDEVHFEPKNVARQSAVSEQGERIVWIRSEDLTTWYSVSCLVSLDQPFSTFIDLREGLNDQVVPSSTTEF